MYLFTQTPAGRMANAVRDNPERAEFIGYSARRVRYISFCASGFFAGIAGGLYALNYEFVTEETLNAVTSGRVLLMAYIGGLGYFIGPILGAVILTLMNSLLSNYTDLWMLYLGILFLLTVLFLPKGFAGFIMMHRVAWLQRRIGKLVLPYLATGIPAMLFMATCVLMLELSHLEDESLSVLSLDLSASSPFTWTGLLLIATISMLVTRRTLPALREAWEFANHMTDEPESE
jgi:branched-chain amino acid transport system permease protein